jgi:hypothetical protein
MFNTNFNNVNYSCSPMKNQNNQTIAYNCSSNYRTVENFEANTNFIVGARYPVNGSQGQNNSLVDNAGGNPAAYTNLFAISRPSPPNPPFSDSKFSFANSELSITGNVTGNFGVYGKDWLYIVTGPNIPKNTYVTNVKTSVDQRSGNAPTYIVTVNTVGSFTSQTVGGGSVNIYAVANTLLQTMNQMASDILSKDYDSKGVFVGKTGKD